MIIIKNRITFQSLFDLAIGLTCVWFSHIMFFEINSIFLGLFFLVGLIPVILFIHYFLHGINKQITIEKDRIIYYRGNRRLNFKISEIERAEIHELFKTDYWGLGFRYIKYFTSSKETIIITNLMSDSYIKLNNVKPEIIGEIFPIINLKWTDKQTKNVDSRKEKLKQLYLKFSNEELMEIANSKSEYTNEAKRIATRILKQRKTAPNNRYI